MKGFRYKDYITFMRSREKEGQLYDNEKKS